MRSADRGNRSDIFLLRVWSDERHEAGASREAIQANMAGLQGRLLHLTTGTAHNFDDLSALLDILQDMITPTSTNDNEGRGKTKLEEGFTQGNGR